MMKLGPFEYSILLAVRKLQDEENAYGVPIQKEIEKNSDKELSVPLLYATLKRLTVKGFLSPYLSEPEHIRGGRAKRLYKLTPEGKVAIREAMRAEFERHRTLKNLQGFPDALSSNA